MDEEDDAAAIAAKMAPARAAASRVARLAVFRAVPQHAWLAAQLLGQWVGPEAAVSEGAVRRWAPVAEVVKDAARWAGWGVGTGWRVLSGGGGVVWLARVLGAGGGVAVACISGKRRRSPAPARMVCDTPQPAPCRLLKKAAPEAMPAIYLDALKAAYERIPAPPAAAPEEEEEGGWAAWGGGSRRRCRSPGWLAGWLAGWAGARSTHPTVCDSPACFPPARRPDPAPAGPAPCPHSCPLPAPPPPPPPPPAEMLPPEQEFLALSDRISKTYAGFNSSGEKK